MIDSFYTDGRTSIILDKILMIPQSTETIKKVASFERSRITVTINNY